MRRRTTTLRRLHWAVARNIGIAWVLTIPAAGATAALAYFLLNPILG